MYIYVEEFYNSLNKNGKKKNSTSLIKNTINNLKQSNSKLILSDKMIYFIIYLNKHNCKFKLIHKMITNVNYTISCRLSRFVFKSIRNRWNKIINIAIINNVEEALLNYFLVLYDLYLNNEKNNNTNFKSIQAKHILGINIKNTRQIKKYFNLNIYHTIYYIDIIFSQIDLKYLSLNNIFIINL